MQVGEIIAFINYMTQILFSLMMISHVFTMFVRAKASAERIGEVFSEENTLKTLPVFSEDKSTNFSKNEFTKQGQHLKISSEESEIKGRIDFENVSFSYPGTFGEPVLKNITFSCLKGRDYWNYRIYRFW